jgi:DNA-binding CsgD family transcriptional regulator
LLPSKGIVKIIKKEDKYNLADSKLNNKGLSERDTKILELWNTETHTYESISSQFSITRERVRQILKKAKKRGFDIKDVTQVSKKRVLNRINHASSQVDEDLFAKFYLEGKSIIEMCDNFSITTEIYYAVEKKLIKKEAISSKNRILNEVKKSMESTNEIDKYREKIILQMRSSNKNYDEICSRLDISKPRVSQIIKKMKDRGINIPNSRNSGWFLDESETIRRVNTIEECLNRGMNMKKISNILGITPHTVKSLIYNHLVKK